MEGKGLWIILAIVAYFIFGSKPTPRAPVVSGGLDLTPGARGGGFSFIGPDFNISIGVGGGVPMMNLTTNP